MWNEIINNKTLKEFNEKLSYFHDSCIKEIHYLSGAYVDERLDMYPINDCRILRVIIQCQNEKESMIEMEFQDLKYLKLLPLDETYTCEILDATMFMQNELIYWCDCGGLSEADLDDYMGTVICAEKLRWRSIINHMGDREFY